LNAWGKFGDARCERGCLPARNRRFPFRDPGEIVAAVLGLRGGAYRQGPATAAVVNNVRKPPVGV